MLTILGTALELVGLAWAAFTLGRAWKRSAGDRKLLATLWAPAGARLRQIGPKLGRIFHRRPESVDADVRSPAAVITASAPAVTVTTEASGSLSLGDQVQQLQARVAKFEVEMNGRLGSHAADIERLKSADQSLGSEVARAHVAIAETTKRLQMDDVLDALPGLTVTVVGVFLELVGTIWN